MPRILIRLIAVLAFVAPQVLLAQWQHRGGAWRLRSELFVALSCSGSASCDLQQYPR